VAVAPARAAAAVDVTVSSAAGDSGTTAVTGFTFTPPAPAITKFSTTTALVAGGTLVTVTGTNLTGATSVVVAGVTWATGVKVLSDTQLQFTAPSWKLGTYDVVVKTPYGTSPVTAATRLTYVTKK